MRFLVGNYSLPYDKCLGDSHGGLDPALVLCRVANMHVICICPSLQVGGHL
jgi:hypothetical protein